MTKTEFLIFCPSPTLITMVSISISGTTIISVVLAKSIEVTFDFCLSFIPHWQFWIICVQNIFIFCHCCRYHPICSYHHFSLRLSSCSPTAASVIFQEHKSDQGTPDFKTLQWLYIACKIKSRLAMSNKFLHEIGPCLSLTSSDTTLLHYFSPVTLTFFFCLFLDDAKFIPGLIHLHLSFPLPGTFFFRYLHGYNLLVISFFLVLFLNLPISSIYWFTYSFSVSSRPPLFIITYLYILSHYYHS